MSKRDFVTRLLADGQNDATPITLDGQEQTFTMGQLYDEVRRGSAIGNTYREQVLQAIASKDNLDKSFDELFFEEDLT